VKQAERIYKIERMISTKRSINKNELMDALEISWATLKRDLEYMRSRLHVPIEFDRENGGYRMGKPDPFSPRYELPGLWFNASEIHALLMMKQLLSSLQPGLLEPHVEPLMSRLNMLLESTGKSSLQEIEKRIFVFSASRRAYKLKCFEVCASALLDRSRLSIKHYSRKDGITTDRVVSPQRLVFYRENWYLDTWCHTRAAIRSFAVDAISQATTLPEPSIEVSPDELERTLAAGYGIFGGANIRWAKLKFSPFQSRWVSCEEWHPDQKCTWEEDGSYVLEVPFSQDPELILNVMRYGPDIEVLEPKDLRIKVAEKHRLAAAQY